MARVLAWCLIMIRGRLQTTHSSSGSTRRGRQSETAIINSHAAYKAILWGCDAREEKERCHPLWLALRQVDEKVFGNWNRKAQKIAMMFVCQGMLLYKSNPCAETLARVPTFLRPRWKKRPVDLEGIATKAFE